MALGAEPRDVARLFVRHGAVLAGMGIVLGVAAAAALSRLMSSLLFGVSPTDPLTYSAVSVGLAALALLAGYLPARRASDLDPVVALRSDGA
jgi:ABC-type lipoprotein release transport system permease subunit